MLAMVQSVMVSAAKLVRSLRKSSAENKSTLDADEAVFPHPTAEFH
jgi:hypothetical protein